MHTYLQTIRQGFYIYKVYKEEKEGEKEEVEEEKKIRRREEKKWREQKGEG